MAAENEPVKENLNRTHEIIVDDEFTEASPSIFAKPEIEATTSKPASKRVSLISTSGFVRPNIEATTNLVKSQPDVIPPKALTKLPSPPRKTLVQPAPTFEFKKPAIPKLQSPPKASVSSRLPASSSSIAKPSIARASFGFVAPKSKTLSVNNSTSNILKPSTGMPQVSKILQPQSSATSSMRNSMSSKENNGLRASYSNKAPSAVSRSANTLKPPAQVTKSLKISPPASVTKVKPVAASKLTMPSKISYSTEQK